MILQKYRALTNIFESQLTVFSFSGNSPFRNFEIVEIQIQTLGDLWGVSNKNNYPWEHIYDA